LDPVTIALIASSVASGGNFISSVFGGRRDRRRARRARRAQREELARVEQVDRDRKVADAALLEASRAYERQQQRGGSLGRGGTIASGAGGVIGRPNTAGKAAIGY